MLDISRELDSSVALYSRKVLIQTKATDILPKWLRFLKGSQGSAARGLDHLDWLLPPVPAADLLCGALFSYRGGR